MERPPVDEGSDEGPALEAEIDAIADLDPVEAEERVTLLTSRLADLLDGGDG